MQTNKFLNQKFDVFIFDENDEEGYDCYVDAVYNLNWSKECTYSDKTQIYLNQDSFSDRKEGLDRIQELKGRVVLDNSPFPIDGATSDVDLTTMMAIRTEFTMQYNIKHMTIYCGLAALILIFVVLGQIYLCCKLRRDTNAKKAKIAEEYADHNDDYSLYNKLLPKTD